MQLRVEALEQIEQDFAALNHHVMTAIDRQEDLQEQVLALAALAERLHMAATSWADQSNRPALVTMARQETAVVQRHVAWLAHHAGSGSTKEVRRRLTLAASQGWTAIEILRRAHS